MKFLPCYNTSDNKGVMKFEKGVFKIISEFSYLRLKFIPEFVMLIYIKYVISENNIWTKNIDQHWLNLKVKNI